MLPFIIIGVTTGCVYALAGMGLVVTFKTSGVFNFAHGAIATVAAYIFYGLHQGLGWPWPVASLVAIVGVGTLGGLSLERVARRVALVATALAVVATVGLSLGIQGVTTVGFGSTPRSVNPFLPISTFRLFGVNVGYGELIEVLISIGAAIVLSVFFKRARLGIAMRGIVDDPELIALSGTSRIRVRSWAWVIGTSFAALAGVLLVPAVGLDPTTLTLLVLDAFGAAALGAFSSLPLTFLGALIIGVGQSLLNKYTGSYPVLGGVADSFPFIVLFFVMLAVPVRQLSVPMRRLASSVQRTKALPRVAIYGGYGPSLIILILIPLIVSDSDLTTWTVGMIFVIVFASLHLLVRTAGQVSLCHVAFVAVGAATFANLTSTFGVPWILALLLAGLITVPLGAIVSFPAIRLRGIYLAIATFGFGILIEQVFYTTSLMFGVDGERNAGRPTLLGLNLTGDKAFYYLVLVVVAVLLVGTSVLLRSRLGRLLKALASSPKALETYGASVNITRLLVFCICAFLAGIAGALYAAQAGVIDSVVFDSNNSLLWLAVLVFASTQPFIGASFVGSSIAAGIMLMVIPGYIQNQTILNYEPILFGISAILIAVLAAGKSPEVRRRRGKKGIGRDTIESALDATVGPVRSTAELNQ